MLSVEPIPDLVSIIMPAFNAEQYIEKAIQSVINQNYTDWELIIIDDGSIDGTNEIISSFEKHDERIIYIYQENGKQSKARNAGINKSRGNYIAFLDADDLWVPEKLEMQINFLKKNPEIDLTFSQGYYLNNNSISNFDVVVKSLWNNNDIDTFIKGNQVPILSVMIKRVKLLSVNGFKENLAIQNVEDYDLWLRLLINNYTFSSVSNRLFYYRVHKKQATYNNSSISLPVIKMFDLLYSTYNLTKFKKSIIERLKWSLFIPEVSSDSFQTMIKILKPTNPTIVNIVKLISKISYYKLRVKLLFKIFSWI